MANPQTTIFRAREQAQLLMQELIKMELFDPRHQTDKDVMTATLSPFLMRAYYAGGNRD